MFGARPQLGYGSRLEDTVNSRGERLLSDSCARTPQRMLRQPPWAVRPLFLQIHVLHILDRMTQKTFP